jgi:death-on-curing protein
MFGGARGVRDPGLSESALTRPVNQHLYSPAADISELAAANAFDLSKNQPFVDGNKRTAFLALGLLLAVNGWRLQTTQIDAIETMMSLARGTLDESALSIWIRTRIVR